MRNIMEVVWYHMRQACYDVRAAFGGRVVLLSDPRWKAEPIDYDDVF